MKKENKTTVDILLELVLGYKKHTDKMYEWVDNLKKSNQELREALGNPVCIAKNPKPRTNFDQITESVESLAEYISYLARKCTFRDCSIEECAKFECKDCIKEWLQKEIEE